MSKVPIVAHRHEHAEYAAIEFLKLRPSDYFFVDREYRLKGIARGSRVVFVFAPRHVTTYQERVLRNACIQIARLRELEVEEVVLP